MTSEAFNSLSIGDILTLPIWGRTIVRACYFQDGTTKVDLEVAVIGEIEGITFADILEFTEGPILL